MFIWVRVWSGVLVGIGVGIGIGIGIRVSVFVVVAVGVGVGEPVLCVPVRPGSFGKLQRPTRDTDGRETSPC